MFTTSMAIQHDSDRFHYTKGRAHRGGAGPFAITEVRSQPHPREEGGPHCRAWGQADGLAGPLGAAKELCPRGTRKASGDQRSRGCCLRECSRGSGVGSALLHDLRRDQEQ